MSAVSRRALLDAIEVAAPAAVVPVWGPSLMCVGERTPKGGVRIDRYEVDNAAGTERLLSHRFPAVSGFELIPHGWWRTY